MQAKTQRIIKIYLILPLLRGYTGLTVKSRITKRCPLSAVDCRAKHKNATEKPYKRTFECVVFACRALRKRMGICPPSVRFTPRSAPRVAPDVATTAIKRSVINLRAHLYGHAVPKGNDNATNDNGRSVHVAYASRSDEGRRQTRQLRPHYSLQEKTAL